MAADGMPAPRLRLVKILFDVRELDELLTAAKRQGVPFRDYIRKAVRERMAEDRQRLGG